MSSEADFHLARVVRGHLARGRGDQPIDLVNFVVGSFAVARPENAFIPDGETKGRIIDGTSDAVDRLVESGVLTPHGDSGLMFMVTGRPPESD